MIVALTAGISALSILADSIAVATTFAVITAGVSALNAGFSPPEAAKKNRNAARAYGHLMRPLGELLFKIDSYYTLEYVPQTGYDEVSKTEYDAGYYRTTGSGPSHDDLRDIWDRFSEVREQIEPIDDTAPALTSAWRRGR